MKKEKVDFVVHIPLEAEFLEFREVFPVSSEILSDLNVICRVKCPSGFTMAAIVQEKMGRSSADAACRKILDLFDPSMYICLGIAGGLSKDLNLGDVCYTGNLIDVYDNSKITDVPSGGIDIALQPEFYQTDRRLTAAIGFVRTLTSLHHLHAFWQEDQNSFIEKIIPEKVPGRDGKMEKLASPKCLNGDVVCGAVTESDTYRDRLKGVTRNILAIETESGPIFSICKEKGIPAITIRGISDYANASKGKLEGDSKEGVRRAAARNAATFLHMQLQSDAFIQSFNNITGGCHLQPTLNLEEDRATKIIHTLGKLSEEIDLKLRELSPQYRTKPTGFNRLRKKAAQWPPPRRFARCGARTSLIRG